MSSNSKPTSCKDARLAYAVEHGWTSFPVPPGTKKSSKSAAYSGGSRWGATKDPDEIKRDSAHWPDAGVGIPTGIDNKIFVVEADTPEGRDVNGIANLKAL